MRLSIENIKNKSLTLLPLILLIYISLTGNTIINFKFFAVNINYIFIYFWVLKNPKILGYGFIFLSGIFTDVIFGLPIGISALTLLVISLAAAYLRAVTVRPSLFFDWISFIPTLLIANFIYFISLYFLNYSIDYLNLIKDSAFTFAFYPIFWIIFLKQT